MSETYMRSRIYSMPMNLDPREEAEVTGRGPVVVEQSTNDDNDDGIPDGEVTRWFLRCQDVAQAVRITGLDRRGYYGQEVSVWLDGERLTAERAAKLGLPTETY